MHRWHSEFEKSAPDEHQEFLAFLHIPAVGDQDDSRVEPEARGVMPDEREEL